MSSSVGTQVEEENENFRRCACLHSILQISNLTKTPKLTNTARHKADVKAERQLNRVRIYLENSSSMHVGVFRI